MKADCFIAGGNADDMAQTISALRQSESINEIFRIGRPCNDGQFEHVKTIAAENFFSSEVMIEISHRVESDFILLYTKPFALQLGAWALERMLQIADDTGAGMIYSNYMQLRNGELISCPVIDYQLGSLRDDFNFGSLMLFRADVFKKCAAQI
ncbi:MAG: glycosyltransferase family 2 protein, partial [Prolixibacteraceae bacterium]|nr:glycosyltransferase family 2 protein [Prolixibacteraceae bacterium]